MSTHLEVIAAAKATGLSCRDCGTLFGANGKGKPRRCDACRELNALERLEKSAGAERDRLLLERSCPHCGKVLRSSQGRAQHIRMVHP